MVRQAELVAWLCYVSAMIPRMNLLIFGQLFLALVFLCAPVADNVHAIKMLQSSHDDSRSLPSQAPIKMAMSEHAPCHEPTMESADAAVSDQDNAGNADDKQPCCPYAQCSPNNCLMHFAFVALSVFEIIPHSPIDSRTFTDTDIHLVSVPFTERLRPPIA